MRIHSVQRGLWRGVLSAALLGLVLSPGSALAFDTGHHSDLTREALAAEGFGDTPIRVVQLQNWLVDYYSNSPSPGSNIEDEVNKLHFDNLFTPGQVRNYWARLRVNTKSAVQQAARSRDTLKLLTITGVTLHGVQDFYSHSNWVELHPRVGRGPYRTETLPGGALPAGMNLFTARAGHYSGPPPPPHVQDHGGYDSGMNHDSYVRPRWDEAYVFGYVGSREWVAAIRAWANEASPGSWDAAKAYSLSGSDRSALDRDHNAAYRMSEWVSLSGANGHWKGSGSGSTQDFLRFSPVWMAFPDSIFIKHFKGSDSTVRQLSAGMTGDSPAASKPPNVGSLPLLSVRAVIVRTLAMKEKDDVGTFELKIDPGGSADFFAKITVAGQTFIETMQLDKASATPAWTTIKFVPASTPTVPIRYELWDEDESSDDHADINPASGKRHLDLVLNLATRTCSGDFSGVFDTAASAVQSDGRKPDSDRAVVRFYVTVADLARKTLLDEGLLTPDLKPVTK